MRISLETKLHTSAGLLCGYLHRRAAAQFFFAAVLFLAFGHPVGATDLEEDEASLEAPEGVEAVSLPADQIFDVHECIQKALVNRRPEWQHQLDVYDAQILQASRSWLPHIQASDQLGALPEDGLSSQWGPVNRFKVEVAYPLYDFGRSRDYKTAAQGRLNAERTLTQKNADQEIVEVVQAYYGLVFARETERNLEDARAKVDDYRARMEKKKKRSRKEELQLDYEILRLESQLAEARSKRDLAYSALAVKIGLSSGQIFDVKDRVLRPIRYDLRALEDYQGLATSKRPEVLALQEGVKAREALVRAEQKGWLPQSFFGGFYEYGDSTVRKYDDDFHYQRGAAGLQFNWVLDWNGTQSKIKSARSEYLKLIEQQRLALPAIQLDVKRAFLETNRLKEEVERGRQARKIGRALLFFAKSNWDIGVGDPQQMKEALIRFNEARFQHGKSIMEFNVAVAKLSQAVGEQLAFLQKSVGQ